ncbi:uncharacterized protein LOC144152559 [Haemaphysalis longicornis]
MAFTQRNLPVLMTYTLLLVAGRMKCDNVEILKTIEKFPNVTAVYSITDTYNGASLKCVKAELTQFDSQEGSATYTWYMKSDGGDEMTITHHTLPGSPRYEANVVSSPDPDAVWIGVFPFSDDKTCYILKGQDIEDLCMLWVSTDSVDNISNQCIQENDKICGHGVLLYDKETCDGNSGYP